MSYVQDEVPGKNSKFHVRICFEDGTSLEQMESATLMGLGGEHHVTHSFLRVLHSWDLLPSLPWDRSVHLDTTSIACMLLSHDWQSHLCFPPWFSSWLPTSTPDLRNHFTCPGGNRFQGQVRFQNRFQTLPSFLPSWVPRCQHSSRMQLLCSHLLALRHPSSSLPQDKLSHSTAQPLFPPLHPCTNKGHWS